MERNVFGTNCYESWERLKHQSHSSVVDEIRDYSTTTNTHVQYLDSFMNRVSSAHT